MSYDNWVTSGSAHTCVCGATWHDSDGGPCHVQCSCGAIVDPYMINDKGWCPHCSIECAHCGEITHVDDASDGLCDGCYSICEDDSNKLIDTGLALLHSTKTEA